MSEQNAFDEREGDLGIARFESAWITRPSSAFEAFAQRGIEPLPGAAALSAHEPAARCVDERGAAGRAGFPAANAALEVESPTERNEKV